MDSLKILFEGDLKAPDSDHCRLFSRQFDHGIPCNFNSENNSNIEHWQQREAFAIRPVYSNFLNYLKKDVDCIDFKLETISAKYSHHQIESGSANFHYKNILERIERIIKELDQEVNQKPEQPTFSDVSEITPEVIAKLVVQIVFESLHGYIEIEDEIKVDQEKHNLINSLLQAKAKLLAADQLLKILYKILGSLQPDFLPAPPLQPTNFIADNKLPASADEEQKRLRLPLSIAEELANTLDLTDKEMATILTISIRTYHRLKKDGLLNPVASERLLLLKELAAYGLKVFEDQNNFNEWLRLPLHELSNKTPLNSLDTATGFAWVKTILGRIDYGVYS